jgi:hypothetical protein
MAMSEAGGMRKNCFHYHLLTPPSPPKIDEEVQDIQSADQKLDL